MPRVSSSKILLGGSFSGEPLQIKMNQRDFDGNISQP